MAQPPPPQHRPPFPQQSQNFTHGYPPKNSIPRVSPQPPPGSMSLSSPSPLPQYSPTNGGQAPPAKRPRLSPDAPSPFSQSMHSPQAGSPVNGQMNGLQGPTTPRPGSMPPPQQPVIKKETGNEDVNFLRTNSMDFSAGSNNGQYQPRPQSPAVSPFQSQQGPSNQSSTAARPSSSGTGAGSAQPSIVTEEARLRAQQRADWEESRHAQHELWDPFLYGANLNDKIKSVSHRANLVEPQAGVLVNTQKNQPPPVVRVNGLEGASRVIRDGQSILDTKEKADRLNELVKLLSLSAKARLTGLVQTAARLALERRQHSQGRVPEDWSDLAVAVKPVSDEPQSVPSPAATAGVKRTHAQANGEESPLPQLRASPHPSKAEFERLASRERKAENARQAKRRKRTEVVTAQENEANAQAEADAIAAAALENERKTTKKERKMAESKISEQQQHASTNQAAAMATANLFGRFAKKKKNYSWMTGTGGGPGGAPSAAPTPTRTSSFSAPSKEKQPEVRKDPRAGQFDENNETGIQARDLLLVLESDGRAARSFVKGSSIVDDAAPKPDI